MRFRSKLRSISANMIDKRTRNLTRLQPSKIQNNTDVRPTFLIYHKLPLTTNIISRHNLEDDVRSVVQNSDLSNLFFKELQVDKCVVKTFSYEFDSAISTVFLYEIMKAFHFEHFSVRCSRRRTGNQNSTQRKQEVGLLVMIRYIFGRVAIA